MIEIVHDLAPNAQIAFATAFNGAESFADNIRALRAVGADIIVDDVVYYARVAVPGRPDRAGRHRRDRRRRALLQLRRQRAERGRRHRRQLGGRLRLLRPDRRQVRRLRARLRPGRGRAGAQPDQRRLRRRRRRSCSGPTRWAARATTTTCTRWPPTAPSWRSPTTCRTVTTTPSRASSCRAATLGLAVVKFSGEDRYFQLTPFRGRFEDKDGLTGYNTPGVTRGHSAVPAAFSVAAVPAAEPFPFEIAPGVPNPSGPYPGVYTRDPAVGDLHLGRPAPGVLQPGRHADHAGQLHLHRWRGADEAGHRGGGRRGHHASRASSAFYGTSASAPHAAAIAALVLSGNPGIAPAEVRTALTSTAIDIEQRGWDRNTGYGIVMADRVLRYTGATPQPLAVPGEPTVTTHDGRRHVRRAGGDRAAHHPGDQPGRRPGDRGQRPGHDHVAGGHRPAGQPRLRPDRPGRDQDGRRLHAHRAGATGRSAGRSSCGCGSPSPARCRRRRSPSRCSWASRARSSTSRTPVRRCRSRTTTTPASRIPLDGQRRRSGVQRHLLGGRVELLDGHRLDDRGHRPHLHR